MNPIPSEKKMALNEENHFGYHITVKSQKSPSGFVFFKIFYRFFKLYEIFNDFMKFNWHQKDTTDRNQRSFPNSPVYHYWNSKLYGNVKKVTFKHLSELLKNCLVSNYMQIEDQYSPAEPELKLIFRSE